MQERILLAEDDLNLGSLLKEYLEIKGFDVTLARDGVETLKLFSPTKFDILILDVMMPRKDGFSVTRDIRKTNNQIPVIYITAKGQKEDKIEGFESGADDYITKPFSMEELLARIKAVLRRTKPATLSPEQEQKVFNFGAFEFNYQLQNLKHKETEIKVSTKEADLLRMLCLHQNSIMLREVALKEIWGDDDYFNARSMDVYITKLRKYLKADPNIHLMNVHGKGYKLMVM
jgi:DNA-binding response OmpR family regulator